MISRKAKITYRGCRKNAYFEEFDSMSEMTSMLASRTCYIDKEHDAPLCAGGTARSNRPSWNNYTDKDDLLVKLEQGVPAEKLKDAKAATFKAVENEQLRLCAVRRDVMGAVPVVPAVLAGHPANMLMQTHKPVKRKVLNLYLDLGVTCDVPEDVYRKVGVAIAAEVASLEIAGYRIGIEAGVSTAEHDESLYGKGGYVRTYKVRIKRPTDSLNLSRLMYVCSDVSFLRGLGFSWMVSVPCFPGISCGLGVPTLNRMDGEEKEAAKAVLAPDAFTVAMGDLVHLSNRAGMEKAGAFVRTGLMDFDARRRIRKPLPSRGAGGGIHSEEEEDMKMEIVPDGDGNRGIPDDSMRFLSDFVTDVCGKLEELRGRGVRDVSDVMGRSVFWDDDGDGALWRTVLRGREERDGVRVWYVREWSCFTAEDTEGWRVVGYPEDWRFCNWLNSVVDEATASMPRRYALAGLKAARMLSSVPGVDEEAAWDVAADFQQALCDLDGIEGKMNEEEEE